MDVSAAQLSEFLVWLRDGGSRFEASDQQFLAAQTLLERLAARGEWPATSRAWQTLLAPVLCSSPAQQERFYELLAAWFAKPRPLPQAEDLRTEDNREKRRLAVPREAWVYGSLSVVVLASLLVGAIRNFRKHPDISDVTSRQQTLPVLSSRLVDEIRITIRDNAGRPLAGAVAHYAGRSVEADASGEVVLALPSLIHPKYLVITDEGFRAVSQKFPSTNFSITLQTAAPVGLPGRVAHWLIHHARSLRFSMMMLSGAMLLFWLIHLWRKVLELRKWATTSVPRLRRIGVSNSNEPLFHGSDVRKLAVALRRRRLEESEELDLQATVDATCRQGGYFSPVFAKRNSEPEYLFLGERKNLRDHQARLQDELIWRLRDHDVFVQRYYFQSNPSICSDAKGEVFSLSDLTAMHPEHETWLALDADRCVDPLSGSPEKWWAHLTQWRYRALLSFNRIEVDTEARISDPTREGVESLAMDAPSASDAPPYPSVLRDCPENWLISTEPPPAAIARLIAQLRMYLGPQGYLLLQACAVYPAIAWNITVSLAGALVPSGERERTLNLLTALPWFRHGVMPDWLRVRLVSRLGQNEENVRAAVQTFLTGSMDTAQRKEEALEIAPGAPRGAASSRALNDHVYLAFASGSRLDRLSVRAPQGWRKFLRDSVVLRAGVGFLLVTMLWFATSRAMAHLVRMSDGAQQSRLAKTGTSSEFVTALMQVADADEAGSAAAESKLQAYSRIASDILKVEDPFARGPVLVELKEAARKVRTDEQIVPGMVVMDAKGAELVKAVGESEVMEFGSTEWIPTKELGDVFDLSGMQLKYVFPATAEPDSIANAPTDTGQSTQHVVSPDGKKFATAEDGKAIGIWDARSSRLLRRLIGHTDRVTSVAWSADSRQLTSTSDDGTIRKWDVANGREVQSESSSGGTEAVAEAARFRAGCASGTAPDCSSLGLRYENGKGVLRNDSQAVALYQKACEGGEATGCALLGWMYDEGKGTSRNYVLAVAAFRKGCDGGDFGGCGGLGLEYEYGDGVEKSYVQAARLFSKACDGGWGSSCSDLGSLYQSGEGLAKDVVRAAQLYKKACDYRTPMGCRHLGQLYESGEGVAKDDVQARVFYKTACDAGDEIGCNSLRRFIPNATPSLSDSPAAPPAPGAQSSVTTATAAPDNTADYQGIQDALRNFEQAYNSRDVGGVQATWLDIGLRSKSLTDIFKNSDRVNITEFCSGRPVITGNIATQKCTETSQYGAGSPFRQVMKITFVKLNGAWVMKDKMRATE